MQEGQQSVPQTDQGVNSIPDAPMGEEATPASNDSGGYQSGDNGVDGTLTPANIRIQKLANEARRYREEAQRLKQDSESLKGARELHDFLRANPDKAKAVMDLLQGRQAPQEQPIDPFANYLPHEREALRAAMEMKEWRAQQERQQQEQYFQSIQENNDRLENLFEDKLRKDGFVDKNGNYDEAEVSVIAGAVLTKALSIARNPDKLTEQELNSAYDLILKGTKSLEKRGLKGTVRSSPPPSASQKGSVPMGKTKLTEEERLAREVRMFEADRARGN